MSEEIQSHKSMKTEHNIERLCCTQAKKFIRGRKSLNNHLIKFRLKRKWVIGGVVGIIAQAFSDHKVAK